MKRAEYKHDSNAEIISWNTIKNAFLITVGKCRGPVKGEAAKRISKNFPPQMCLAYKIVCGSKFRNWYLKML